MKSIRRTSLFKLLVLAVVALGATAFPAHAQSTAIGTFNLAHKAHWGTAVLPAGSYQFRLDTQTWPARITVRQTDGSMIAIVLPRMISRENLKASSMVMNEKGGESVISVLRLASVGLELEFGSPKLPEPGAEVAALAPIAKAQPAK